MNIRHIRNNAELAEMASRLAGRDFIALDTEFMRVDTFYPRLALIQIGDGENEYLIDPLLITDFSPLLPLLQQEYPRKIFHACSEDIEVLTRLLGAKPKGVIDTQIAAAFLGQGLQVGYQKVLQENLGIDIPKGESRSDWLQRPLSEAQISYAALDVKYLPPLYEQLSQALNQKKLSNWFESDCGLMLEELDYGFDPALAYRDMSNAWRLRRQQLAVLRELLFWRDTEARQRNVPRSFIIRNASLMPLAITQPSSLQALSAIDDITPRILRKEGEKILDIIFRASQLPATEWPEPLPPPLPKEAKQLFDGIKSATKPVSVKTAVPEEVLLRKRHVEALVLERVDKGEAAELPKALQGWRGELLLPVLEPVLLKASDDIQTWRAMRQKAVEMAQ